MGGCSMDDADADYTIRAASAPPRRLGCAGTEASTEAPCEAPIAAEVDGPPLCEGHAGEFGAEARADVLEVAGLYLSRWLRCSREGLCNAELARRLEDALKGVETERPLGAPRQTAGTREAGGARTTRIRPAMGGDSSPAAETEDTGKSTAQRRPCRGPVGRLGGRP